MREKQDFAWIFLLTYLSIYLKTNMAAVAILKHHKNLDITTTD